MHRGMQEQQVEEQLPRPTSPLAITPVERRLIGVVIIGLWLGSLATPAAYLARAGTPIGGIDVLFMGWMGLLLFQPAWLANPMLLIVLPAFVFLKEPGWLVRGGGIALAMFTVAAFFWNTWPVGTNYSAEIHFGLGFYLWIAAVGGTAILSVLRS